MFKIETAKLSNGIEMPWVGLGTYPCRGEELIQGVKSAIGVGYKSFDTASHYENEQDIIKGIEATGGRREGYFITTKFWNKEPGFDNVLKAFEKSLELLNTDYVDLYLLHFPGKEKHVETWRAFERIYEEKRARSIGVSNFLPHHIKILEQNCNIIPVINQIEAHPYYMDYETIEYCQSRSIFIEAYCPLASPGSCDTRLFDENVLQDISKKHEKTPAQITLRYLLQKNIIVIPKTMNPVRQAQNADIFDFELNSEEITSIDTLNTNKRLSFDPDEFSGI